MRMLSRHHQPAATAAQQGFTLLEVVAALAVLALGLGLSMQALSGAMNQSRISAEQTHAALLAQTVLDNLGAVEPLEEGEYSGEFEHGYRWYVNVTPYLLEEEGVDLISLGQSVELMRVDLEIEWQRGQREMRSRFSTLRAMYRRDP
ncbi:prepilin-type N-terminal cleavage/methylation domain-containing protein [Pseudomarimonas arenosa]|uniref:Prepilin-type N-terminal cleavage/methylation domain-containing protein n=1 Tax=Pseudomarimonas arenosa TaxID=2774145 RepID=A0AAW3ZQ59_9GAMM|nr:prepilin-type N-terminal cleavage/methylation domain-containing protein [Pseudomarimonas arenosa]MBD8526451.1 prepilin-type N-terminal cleavage/methylation domain-containing protein [Pseudomarimonas arenosa]